LPQTVTGVVIGAVVPLPDTGPLLSPDPFEPVLPEPPEPPGAVPLPQVLLDLPVRTVAELPHTVTGAVAETDVPLPDPGPLWLPLPDDAEPWDPPVPTDAR